MVWCYVVWCGDGVCFCVIWCGHGVVWCGWNTLHGVVWCGVVWCMYVCIYNRVWCGGVVCVCCVVLCCVVVASVHVMRMFLRFDTVYDVMHLMLCYAMLCYICYDVGVGLGWVGYVMLGWDGVCLCSIYYVTLSNMT